MKARFIGATVVALGLLASACSIPPQPSQTQPRPEPETGRQESGRLPSDEQAVPPAPPEVKRHERPNVVIIVVDDMRSMPLSVLRTIMPRTIQWMRDEGAYYPNAFVTTPLCCPSRATIMTGQYAHNNGVLRNHRADDFLRQEDTIQRYLHEAGYRTGFVGKYLNAWKVEKNPPYFDYWVLVQRDGSEETAYYDRTFNRNGKLIVRNTYTTDVLANHAVQFIRRADEDAEKPFYLYVAPTAPHAPFIPAKRHENAPVPNWKGNPSLYEKDTSDKPYRRSQATRAQLRNERKNQMRMLMAVDELVDRIMRELEVNGELDNTLVIFTSDHGYLWGEHGYTAKFKPYTESIGVPFFVRWPGHVPTGKTNQKIVGLQDIAPTIMDAVGVVPEHIMDGRSLFSQGQRRRMLTEFFNKSDNGGWASIRTKRFQYVEHYDADGTVRFREYYDLRKDPWQMRNVLADGDPANDPRVQWLSKQLAQDRSCAGATCP